jgi:hypothetical protein
MSLIAFNLVFALQNAMDIIYLWGEARLPGDMTMADYAHRGAYPLIATALLAALFVLVALRPGSTTARTPAIRALVLLWVAQNIFLVSSSIERLIDYVGSYSLTELRIVVLGWMALVAFGLAAICWRMLRDKSAGWLININLAAGALMLTATSFVDLGAVAASWNVRHAREAGGPAVALDLCYLRSLGDSAVLPLIELEQRPGLDPIVRERVQAVRVDLFEALEWNQQNGGWTVLGRQRLERARQLLAGAAPAKIREGERGCSGRLYPPNLAAPAPIQSDEPTVPEMSRMASPSPDPR